MMIRKCSSNSVRLYRVRSLHFVSGSSVIPGPLKNESEDSHFYHRNGFGVFDGVGSWRDKDVSPRAFPQILMTRVLDNLREERSRSLSKILHNAWKESKHELGASTALVCKIQNNKHVDVVNVGDSQCIHVRDGEVIWRSKPQHHRFNCPYQLGSHSKDEPLNVAKEAHLSVEKGDIFVSGSDGLFDNLNDEEILESIESAPATILRSNMNDAVMSLDKAKNGLFNMKVGKHEINANYTGFLFGSNESCDLNFQEDERVSRHHCVFSFHDPSVITVTDASRHGTFLNGERLPVGIPSILFSGDVISIGIADPDEAKEQNLPVFTCGHTRNSSFMDSVNSGNSEVLNTRARWLSSYAFRRSLNKDAVTPFSLSAMKQFGSKVSGRGGKMDDITVVISRIAEEDENIASNTYYSKRDIVEESLGEIKKTSKPKKMSIA